MSVVQQQIHSLTRALRLWEWVTGKPNPNLQLASSGWSFSMNDAQEWEWVCHDSHGKVAKRCARAFATLIECMADATAHGYVAERTDCWYDASSNECGFTRRMIEHGALWKLHVPHFATCECPASP
jgi:hypothetical protein